MKPNRSLLMLRVAGISALLLCVVCFGFVPQARAAENVAPWSIQVEPVQAEEGQLPPDFSMAIYEDLLAQLKKGGQFHEVYRSGDRQADTVPNLITLQMTLLNFERGNQTQRAVTTVKGATKVQVHLKVAVRGGDVVVEKDVQGTVRLFGENLKATSALARSIADTLRDTPLPAPGAAKAAGQ